MEPAWIAGAAGGLLIGIAGAIYLLGAGRIMGLTGIVAQATGLSGGRPGALAAAFLAGALGGSALFVALAGAPPVSITGAPALLVASGLAVGLGVRLSNGCTSGHGVCGLSRLSVRSVAAVATFMGAAALTVALVRHGIGGL